MELRRQPLPHEVYEYEIGWIEDGRVEFSSLLPGTYNVTIECREYQAFASYPPLVVREHNVGGIDWRVSETWVPTPDYSRYAPSADEIHGVGQHWTGKIRGRVIDETGTPMPELEIYPNYVGKIVSVPHVKSDARGEFEIEGLPAGKVELMIWDRRRPDHEQYVTTRAGDELETFTDRTTETELIVESRRGTIMGVLHDEQGHPVADALVLALDQRFRPAEPTRASLIDWNDLGEPVSTDEHGRFVVDGLPEREFVVGAYRRGGGEAVAMSVQVGSELELIITPGGSIAGTVVLDDGSVPRSFRVHAENRSLEFETSDDFRLTDGTWRLNNLPPGQYELSVGFDDRVAQAEVQVAAGEVIDGIELRASAGLVGNHGQDELGQIVSRLRVIFAW